MDGRLDKVSGCQFSFPVIDSWRTVKFTTRPAITGSTSSTSTATNLDCSWPGGAFRLGVGNLGLPFLLFFFFCCSASVIYRLGHVGYPSMAVDKELIMRDGEMICQLSSSAWSTDLAIRSPLVCRVHISNRASDLMCVRHHATYNLFPSTPFQRHTEYRPSQIRDFHFLPSKLCLGSTKNHVSEA